jgi:hypothetical protein
MNTKTTTTIAEAVAKYPQLAMPEGLSAKGKKAWRLMMQVFSQHPFEPGSSPTFRNPKTWTGEYGRKSHLVIVYEEGDLGIFFDYDRAAEFGGYRWVEELNEAFKGSGLYTECCTSCYSAVYEA